MRRRAIFMVATVSMASLASGVAAQSTSSTPDPQQQGAAQTGTQTDGSSGQSGSTAEMPTAGAGATNEQNGDQTGAQTTGGAAERGPGDADVGGNDIVVTGQRASLEASRNIKRNSDQVVDSIVADDIGKFPDNTVAAALQRVPGIQVVNGFNNEISSPLIRGIGDIQSTLDGREIFTGVGRGFAFQDIPAEAIAGADVYKSNSADLIEGGVAGTINLKLQKPFNFHEGLTVAANARGLYGKEVDKFSYTAGVLASYRAETGIGEIGILVDGSYSDQKFNRPISFNCDPRSGGIVGAPGVVLPTCAGGLTDTGGYQRPQGNFAIQWRPSEDVEVYLDGLYAGYRAKFATYFIFSDLFATQGTSNVVATDTCFDAPVDGGGFRGPSRSAPNGTPIPNLVTQNLCLGQSATYNNVPGLTSTQAKTGRTDQYVLGGGVRFNRDRFHFNLDYSYIQSKNRNTNEIVDIAKSGGVTDVIINDKGHGTLNQNGNPLGTAEGFLFANTLFQDYNRSNSSLFAGKADAQYDVDSFIKQIQVGFRGGTRKAKFEANAAGGPGFKGAPNQFRLPVANYLTDGFLVRSPATIPYINGGEHWITPSADYIRDNIADLRVLYGASPDRPGYDPLRGYDVTEQTIAGYGQAKYEIGFGGDVILDGLVGVRYTRTKRSIQGTTFIPPQDAIPATANNPGRPAIAAQFIPAVRDTVDDDFLPNASARLRLTPQFQLRATYAKTLSRPGFGDLNPGLSFNQLPTDGSIATGQGGNPDLKPQKSNAYDATAEYYFGRSSYVSVAGYYRDIKNRVVGDQLQTTINGILTRINTPRNLGSVTLKGVEVATQTFFDFLPEGLDGLGTIANFTYADSKIKQKGDVLEGQPLLGVSKYSYNVGALYEKYGLTARVVYNWRSKYDESFFGFDRVTLGGGLLVPGDQPFFNRVKSNGRLDFSVSYDITPNLTVSVDGVNVAGGKYHSYFNTPEFPHDIRVDDKFYGASVRARF